MKYKVGDKVKIKSKKWYKNEKDEYGNVDCGSNAFIPSMVAYCGMPAVITRIPFGYKVDIDNGIYEWTDEMFEDGNAEEGHLISLPVVHNSQVLLNQISTLTQTLAVLCNTGRAKSANIVEEKIMQLIEKL
ncbi:MAG: hypothetical protein WC319_12500 [Candidatus Paceibacterota bacterium]|jgi:hypothetical protein